MLFWNSLEAGRTPCPKGGSQEGLPRIRGQGGGREEIPHTPTPEAKGSGGEVIDTLVSFLKVLKFLLLLLDLSINLQCPGLKALGELSYGKQQTLLFTVPFYSQISDFPLSPITKAWKNVRAFNCFQLSFTPKVLNQFLALCKFLESIHDVLV